ncbi:MAG: class I SAM-dependent methyltransferase [Herpetosiphon sp.]
MRWDSVDAMQVTGDLNVEQSYDRVAADYALHYHDELAHKPFDRHMLQLLAEKAGNAGPICDLGCGPGQVAAYLYSLGVKVCGIDISPEMVRQAQRLHPSIPFSCQTMLRLADVADGTFAGIAAFYSIIHVERGSVVDALREMRRVLRQGGSLLLAFHVGQEVRHLDEWFDQAVKLDFCFFDAPEMTTYLQQAGFVIQEVIVREPYVEVEVPTRRAYLFAQRPLES